MGIRFGLAAIFAAFVSMVSGSASATTVYYLGLTGNGLVGESALVSGTITTDSHTGVLSTQNILDWSITLTTHEKTFTLDGEANSDAEAFGPALTATKTGLFFDFSSPAVSLLGFKSPRFREDDIIYNYICFADAIGTCGPDPGVIRVSIENEDGIISLGSGVQKFAIAVGVAATPLPSAAILFASALAGLGFAGWRKGRNGAASS